MRVGVWVGWREGRGWGGGAVFTLFPSCLIYFHTLMFSSSRRLRGKPHRIKPESTPDCLKPLMQPSAIFFVLSVSPPFSREKLKALPARLAEAQQVDWHMSGRFESLKSFSFLRNSFLRGLPCRVITSDTRNLHFVEEEAEEESLHN